MRCFNSPGRNWSTISFYTTVIIFGRWGGKVEKGFQSVFKTKIPWKPSKPPPHSLNVCPQTDLTSAGTGTQMLWNDRRFTRASQQIPTHSRHSFMWSFLLVGAARHRESYNDRFWPTCIGLWLWFCRDSALSPCASLNNVHAAGMPEHERRLAIQLSSKWCFFGPGSSENVHFNIVRPWLTGIFRTV